MYYSFCNLVLVSVHYNLLFVQFLLIISYEVDHYIVMLLNSASKASILFERRSTVRRLLLVKVSLASKAVR